MANARVTVDRSRGNFPKRNGQNQRRTESKRLQHRLPMLWKTKHEDNWPESAFRRSDITTCIRVYVHNTSRHFQHILCLEVHRVMRTRVPSFLSRARCESVAAFTRFDHQSHGSRYNAKKTRKLATILPNHSSRLNNHGPLLELCLRMFFPLCILFSYHYESSTVLLIFPCNRLMGIYEKLLCGCFDV